MPYNYLVTVSDVFSATGQNPDLMTDAEPSVQGAIARATIHLEQVLETNLQHLQVTDTFYISGLEGDPLNSRYKLKLSNGCVKQTVGFVAEVADALEGPYKPLAGSSITWRTGLVLVPSEGLLGKYVRVQYQSGFAAADEPPMELQQALLCYIPQLLIVGFPSADVEGKKTPTAQVPSALGDAMCRAYSRRTGACIKPLTSDSAEVV